MFSATIQVQGSAKINIIPIEGVKSLPRPSEINPAHFEGCLPEVVLLGKIVVKSTDQLHDKQKRRVSTRAVVILDIVLQGLLSQCTHIGFFKILWV